MSRSSIATQQMKLKNTPKPQLLSLFCGAGGMDLGFEQAGYETCLAIDNWDDAVNTFNHNFSSKPAVCRDLAELRAKDFLKLVPTGVQPVGLIGGPPCQGFSRSNVSADPDDPRNMLPFRYVELVKAAKEQFGLKFFVFENVTGLQSQKHAARFANIQESLIKAGFNIYVQSLNAVHFSVPQRRHRLIIVGINNTISDFEFSFPDKHETVKNVRDAIHGLPEPVFFKRGLNPSDMTFHPNHWTMAPKSPKFSSKIKNKSQGRSFRRLQWDSPSATVAYGNREIHVHPSGKRRLSLYEAMLLQGFEFDFQLTGTLSSQVTQVSNAVPPPLALAIAKKLLPLSV